MSYVMMFSNPASEATEAAPMTPAAGPDRIIFTACRRIPRAGTVPPFAWMTFRRPAKPEASRRCSNRPRYRSTTGRVYADMTTVEVRSYSRSCGRTSEESEM